MIPAVSQILSERYGVTGRPGAKIECPFCHHRTFSIKRDDTIGKCFHPECGEIITIRSDGENAGRPLADILDRMYHDFHRGLLQDRTNRGAYAYCVNERCIHPRVVADSMLGAVPANFDFDELFGRVIEAIEERAVKSAKRQASPSDSANEQREHLVSARDKLKACLRGHNGSLAFFYTDSSHHITAIRFRKPFSKDIVFFKPDKLGGVFNHDLFSPVSPPDSGKIDRSLLVLEGEFNQLQLQSLCAREAELRGERPENGYVFACAVGGVHNADMVTIKRLSATPYVCYDHDSSDAGFALVEKLREVVPVCAFTTPRPDSDLDDFVRGYGDDVSAAHAAIKSLIAGAKLYTIPYEVVKNEIDGVRRNQGTGKNSLKRFEVHRRVAEIIIGDLSARGLFYYDGSRGYVFLNDDRLLVPIEKDGVNLDRILSHYGMLSVEDVHTHVLEALRLHASEQGARTEVYTLSHYDGESNTLYLFDLRDRVFRVTADAVEMVDNGTNGVLFVQNPAHRPFALVHLAPGESPIRDRLLSQIRFAQGDLTEDEQRVVFLLFLYSLFFPELFPTKPLLALIGERGCGKTSVLRKIGRLLFGSSFNVMPLSKDSRDFDAAVTHEHFVAIDNIDSHVPWLDDRLALAATGGTIKLRELYTTNRMAEFPLRAFIGLTSRTPHFRREDVADRLLIFALDRFDAFRSEANILAEFDASRDRMMTEVIGHLQEIVRALAHSRTYSPTIRFRMADFGTFALKIAHAQGWGDRMEALLERMTKAQSSFVAEDNPIIDALDIWLRKGANVGREVLTRDLCVELLEIAKMYGIRHPWEENARAFAQHLRGLSGTLRDVYGIVERRGKGRKRYLSFYPKEEAQE